MLESEKAKMRSCVAEPLALTPSNSCPLTNPQTNHASCVTYKPEYEAILSVSKLPFSQLRLLKRERESAGPN